jgi:sugar phosphate isomerase/epimerase
MTCALGTLRCLAVPTVTSRTAPKFCAASLRSSRASDEAGGIAWDDADQAELLRVLGAAGVRGIEIAPTKLWPGGVGATPAAAARARDALADDGFSVPALQSILFGRPDLHLFGEPSGLVAHIGQVAALAGALGAGLMVFGSPRNRLRGDLAPAEAMRRAADVFRDIGAVCEAAGTTLGIEANPAEYGGDFLLTWREAAELVALVDHPGIRLHLDAACTMMSGDDPVNAARACAGLIGHFHVSAPRLEPVEEQNGIDHAGIAAALRAGGYNGWISIEMRRTDTPVPSVRQAVEYARRFYG